MLPDKLFQNEDSNDSDEHKNQTDDHESKEQINSSSIAETLEQNIDPSNEQKEHIDDEVCQLTFFLVTSPFINKTKINNNYYFLFFFFF